MKASLSKILFGIIISSLFFSFLTPDNQRTTVNTNFNFGGIRKMGLDSITYNEATVLIDRYKWAHPNDRNSWFVSKSAFNWLGNNDGFNHYFTNVNGKIEILFCPTLVTNPSPAVEVATDNKTIFWTSSAHLTQKYALPTNQVEYNAAKQNITNYSMSALRDQNRSTFIGRTALYNIVYNVVPNKIGWEIYLGMSDTGIIGLIVVGTSTESPTFTNFITAKYIGTTFPIYRPNPTGTIGNGASCVKPCPSLCGDF